jgi:hypothetical protein
MRNRQRYHVHVTALKSYARTNPVLVIIIEPKLGCAIVHRARNKEELKRWIQYEWDNIDKKYFTKLFESYPTRCQAVIDANGAHTKY